ncbi:MAG: 5-formyltetrahydrofolate cyclo-ligase [Pseudomonadota bacterium]
MTIRQKKRELRALARAKRAGAHRSVGSIGVRLADNFMDWAKKSLPMDRAVSGYHPIGNEADVMPLLAALAKRGQPLCLPTTVGRDKPLIFRSWSPGEPLVSGAHDILEPAESAPALDPDLLLIPLLAFDLAGGRLGYGAGHYDRTLAGLADRPPLKVGVAYAGQRFDAVPMEETDQFLDAVLTEYGLAWFERRGPATGIA